MKKQTIWLLTVVLAFTFAGLLYIQIVYVHDMVRMRNEQFAESVKRSLYAVAGELEQNETRYFLEEDVAQIHASVLPRYSLGGANVLGIKYSFSTPEGMEGDLTIKSPQLGSGQSSAKGYGSSRLQDVVKEQYLYQKALLNEVILNIMSQSSDRPIFERADSSVVNRLLQSELDNNGLTLPYEFAVTNRGGTPAYCTAGFVAADADVGNTFVQPLFPNDNSSRPYYLKVYFPDKRGFIFHSLNFVVPSFVFTAILLLVFIYTIAVTFRQKKLSEMKNDFINNMTHEFKTPISSISLAAQMLNDSSVRKSSKMLEHISTVISDETKRLRFQVEKVLQMSMFDRQRTTLRLQEVNANEIITNIVNTFKLKVSNYGGAIEMDLRAVNAVVYVDEMHFTNVIFNLLDNAVKYRQEDVPLRLMLSTDDTADGKDLKISVADNGIGIRKEDIKRVFEKFYRVSTGNRHDVKGFGLGLTYVQKMVREFGGTITVESEIRKGTKFNILLPLTNK